MCHQGNRLVEVCSTSIITWLFAMCVTCTQSFLTQRLLSKPEGLMEGCAQSIGCRAGQPGFPVPEPSCSTATKPKNMFMAPQTNTWSLGVSISRVSTKVVERTPIFGCWRDYRAVLGPEIITTLLDAHLWMGNGQCLGHGEALGGSRDLATQKLLTMQWSEQPLFLLLRGTR